MFLFMKEVKMVKGKILAFFITSLVVLFFFPAPTEAASSHVLIGYGNQPASYIQNHYHVNVIDTFENVRIISVEADDAEVQRMKNDTSLSFVQPNNTIRNDFISPSPSRPKLMLSYNEQPNSLINLPKAREEGLTGQNVNVCVVDTGVNTSHEALSGRIGGYASFIKEPDGTINTTDYIGHGTHVSGIIAGYMPSKNFMGIAPNARIYSAKVFNKEKDSTTESLVNAIDWCLSENTSVINMSLGYAYIKGADYSYLNPLNYAITKAYNQGVLTVAASGNEGDTDLSSDNVNYPARFTNAISVASSDSSGRISYFSNRGPSVLLTAPGESILSSYISSSSSYAYLSGTSMATPTVAGVIALIKQKYPSLTNAQIINLLKTTAVDKGAKGRDSIYGCGIVQAYPLSSDLLSNPPALATFKSYNVQDGYLTIEWNPVYDCDLKGYNVYLNDQKLNNSLLTTTSIQVPLNNRQGSMSVRIEAVDDLNNVSTSSSQFSLTFSDVSPDYWAYDSINYVFTHKWMGGMGDGTFQPARPLTRAEAASLLSRLVDVSSINTTSSFVDVPKDNWAYVPISQISNSHFMVGTSPNMFSPMKYITREEIAVILTRLLKPTMYTGPSMFNDVRDPNHWAYSSIVTLAHEGYLAGCGNNNFCPSANTTRAEIAALLQRTGATIQTINQ